MAKRKRKKKGLHLKRLLALLVLVVLAALGIYGYACSRIVHVDYVDAYISGLSPFLEGTRVLFASDFKITGEKSARDSVKLMRTLCEANPDIVLLGGDYTGMSLSDLFRAQTQEGRAAINDRLKSARETFFSGLAGLSVPGGIYAVSGDADVSVEGLYQDCALGRVTLLENATHRAMVNDSPILIVGCAYTSAFGSRAFQFRNATDAGTVLVLAHNPDASKQISTVKDENGNAMADLIFCGHTLGGQVNLFGKCLMTAAGAYNGDFPAGLYDENDKKSLVKMLVSSGVGSDWLPFRLGSRAQVYMVTLHRK